MGHHIFSVGDNTLIMRDGNVAVLRHFLIQAATELRLKRIQETIQKWERLGNGVWDEIEENELMGQTELFKRARANVERFGIEVPAKYLNTNVHINSGIEWHDSLPTEQIIQDFKALAALVNAAG